MQQPVHDVSSWRREDDTGKFLISTELNLLDHGFINDMFATDDLYWAGPVSPELLTLMLSHSLNFGLYEISPRSRKLSNISPVTNAEECQDEGFKQIGLARFVTDFVSFVYITDVYIVPEYRGKGLGKWLMECWEQVMRDMPQLRRALLLTSSDRTKQFYEQGLGMWDSREEGEQFCVMVRKKYKS